MGVSRRGFLKGLALGGTTGYLAMAGASSTVLKDVFIPPASVGDFDIGTCKSVKVTVVSETSWFSNERLVKDMKDAGGLLVNQYIIPWSNTGVKEGYNGSNAGGYCALIDLELLDGTKKKILLDTGWNTEWMDECFKREGVDKMLKNKEIDVLVISHEHFDHFWGIETVLKYDPDISVIVPKGFYKEGFELLKGANYPIAHVKNDYPHKGPLEVRESGKVHPLFPGCATISFNSAIICRVLGEQGMVFNVKDKGLVAITGCCHMGIISFLEEIKHRVKGGDKIYGVQGGLHISPFEDWDPQYDDLIQALPSYGVEVLACNHCTGYLTAEKMILAGLPVVQGTARFRSKKKLFLGNGDQIVFG